MLPAKIGRYEILHEIGRGGMSTVFLARDPSFRRRVAIKVLPASYIHAEDMRGRFAREARVIAELDHPNIVPVYDYGEDNEQPYIVMRYMPGGTLAERIAGQPMPLAQIVPILQRVAEALTDAHTRGILHRDLKPANVMFDGRGQAFLSDFGLAKFFEGNSTALTITGVMGTPAYMSPEQALDEELDGRSDIYSLGIMVYEMLTGRQPYEAKTPAALMIKHVMVITPQIDTTRLGLPAECNAVLTRALAKDRKDRHPTPTALAADLAALVPSTALIVRPNFAPRKRNNSITGHATVPLMPTLIGWQPKVRRWLTRQRVLWGAGGLAVALAIGMSAFLWRNVNGGGPLLPTATAPATLVTVPAPLALDSATPTIAASHTATALPPTETLALPTSTPIIFPTETLGALLPPPTAIIFPTQPLPTSAPPTNPAPTQSLPPTHTAAPPPTTTPPAPATPTLAPPVEPSATLQFPN